MPVRTRIDLQFPPALNNGMVGGKGGVRAGGVAVLVLGIYQLCVCLYICVCMYVYVDVMNIYRVFIEFL